MLPGALRPIVLAIPVVTGACMEPGCDDYAAPGIVVNVRDAVTGQGLTQPLVAVAQEGAYVDTLGVVMSYVRYAGAYERVGTYRVEVHGEGYQLWERTSIRVQMEDKCHVRPVVLDVRLTPTSPPN